MFRLLETIKLSGKKFYNLEYHQSRLNKARKELFGLTNEIDLAEELKIPAGISDSVFKVRVIYSDKIHDVEFHPYTMRNINSLQIVEANDIDYSYKYEDRSKLQKLLCKCTADDVLIIKNGFVTDTSYSNIVLSKGSKFFTPTSFLLSGTKRQKLLAAGVINEVEVSASDLNKYEKIYLINSMMDLDEQQGIPVEKIKGLEVL
ncbi:MAG: para-aminobenzoate synthase component I [Stygiobacter sp.]|nr:MAG: para-aminobenzoate synthase component I [Stygiobacter sp.]KAF0217497.1 MAG: para-aminobenzoate synthase component [Ignavibacteria bacterium]